MFQLRSLVNGNIIMEGKQREGFLFEPLRKQDLNAEDNENFE